MRRILHTGDYYYVRVIIHNLYKPQRGIGKGGLTQ